MKISNLDLSSHGVCPLYLLGGGEGSTVKTIVYGTMRERKKTQKQFRYKYTDLIYMMGGKKRNYKYPNKTKN